MFKPPKQHFLLFFYGRHSKELALFSSQSCLQSFCSSNCFILFPAVYLTTVLVGRHVRGECCDVTFHGTSRCVGTTQVVTAACPEAELSHSKTVQVALSSYFLFEGPVSSTDAFMLYACTRDIGDHPGNWALRVAAR